jgi:hypothetical protein
MTQIMNYDRCFWIALFFSCLVFGLLVIPTYDDGNYFYQYYNTIGLKNPFYSDFYGQYFHFMKPTMLLYALLLSGAESFNYRILAIVLSAEILLCIWLVYLCARRYASREAAQAGACVFTYLFLADHWSISPLRPETTVMLCCLATFWLCECFKKTGALACMAGASAIVFLVAIPMHTCGSIPCIYLLLFVLANLKQFSRKLLLAFCALSCAFAVAGAALLIYPGISSFAGSLALFSFDGDRFNGGLLGEYNRICGRVINSAFSPLLIFIASIYLISLICACKHIGLHSLKHRLNIALFLGAIVIGLGVLPSAPWVVYSVYYYFPLVLGFSIACDVYTRRGGNLALLRCVLVLSGTLIFWYSYGTRPMLFVALYAGGFYLAAVFAGRMTAARLTVLIVVPMLLAQSVVMVSTKIIFDRAEYKIKKTRDVDVVLAGSLFIPSRENVFSSSGFALGAKLQINPGASGAMIELKSVAEEKAEKISNHSLVKLFGPFSTPHQKPTWSSPRALGATFYVITSDFYDIVEFLSTQETSLWYARVKETPLSNEVLDTFANPLLRGLKFVEYSCSRPTP